MKKTFTVLLFLFSLTTVSFAQLEERFGYLTQNDMKSYIKPFATSLGMAFNSAGYHSADVADVFGFSFGVNAMMIMVPDDQLSFNPDLPEGYSSDKGTATIYGDKGGYFAGPGGYIVYPAGVNQKTVYAAMPQVTLSMFGTEVLVRYVPEVPVTDEDKLSVFGIGVKHDISTYVPVIPIDLSFQVLYNSLEITNILDIKNLAFNLHASKGFGLATVYGGLQYETSTLNVDYTYTGNISGQNINENFSVEVDGDNSFRATLGAAVKLAFLVLNADASFGSQTVLTAGLTFEF